MQIQEDRVTVSRRLRLATNWFRCAQSTVLATAAAALLYAGDTVAREAINAISPGQGVVTPVTQTVWRPHPQPTAGSTVAKLDFAAILQPAGFERQHWASFDHVAPGPGRTTAAPERNRFVVVLDPGHGGSDPGSLGPNGLLEKHLTLDIALRTELFLSEIGDIKVILTRQKDVGLSRQARVAAVKRSNADLIVSLHLNQLPQTHVTLVESFYAAPRNIAESQSKQRAQHRHTASGMIRTAASTESEDLTFTERSARLARIMQKRIFDEVKQNNSRTANAGVKQDTLYVLTRSFTPGVLIEMTCLSNADEAERLTTVDYRNRLAAAVADGIRDYLRTLPDDVGA